MSSVLPTVYENVLRRSQHKAKLLRERQRQARTSATLAGDYEIIQTSGEPAATPGISIPWKRIGIAALAVFAICAGTITVIEAVAGKPVSAVVRDTDGSGYTFSGGPSGTSHTPQAAPRRHTRPAPAGTPSTTPSPVPSSSSSSSAGPSPSPSPSSSPAPSSSPTPNPSASTSPSAPAAPSP